MIFTNKRKKARIAKAEIEIEKRVQELVPEYVAFIRERKILQDRILQMKENASRAGTGADVGCWLLAAKVLGEELESMQSPFDRRPYFAVDDTFQSIQESVAHINANSRAIRELKGESKP